MIVISAIMLLIKSEFIVEQAIIVIGAVVMVKWTFSLLEELNGWYSAKLEEQRAQTTLAQG